MSDLSSCYFCGTALDESVETYPVVPEELHPSVDAQATVTLCPTCREKLARVLDVVLGAVEDHHSVAASPDDAASPDADLEAAFEEQADLLHEIDERAEEPAEEDVAADEADDGPGEPIDTETARDDEGTDEQANAEATADREPDSGGIEATDDDPWSDATIGDQGADADDESETDDEPETEAVTGEDETAGEAATGTPDVGESATEDEAETGTGTEDGDDADDTSDGRPAILSSRAGQKVIKLLQNREFPIDRAEFEIVASNAYDIPEQDTEDVVDALVSEGYLGEDDGQLVRP